MFIIDERTMGIVDTAGNAYTYTIPPLQPRHGSYRIEDIPVINLHPITTTPCGATDGDTMMELMCMWPDNSRYGLCLDTMKREKQSTVVIHHEWKTSTLSCLVSSVTSTRPACLGRTTIPIRVSDGEDVASRFLLNNNRLLSWEEEPFQFRLVVHKHCNLDAGEGGTLQSNFGVLCFLDVDTQYSADLCAISGRLCTIDREREELRVTDYVPPLPHSL
jgi:hypothetical protein